MARYVKMFHAGGGPTSSKNDSAVNLIMVTPGYFETMGIPRVAGRDFRGEIASGPKTAVVNRAFVERFFGGENPIGQQVTGGGATYQVVGVVGNVKTASLGEEFTPVLYRSLQQNIGAEPSLLGYTLVVHTAGHPAAMGKAVRQQIHALDRSMAVFNEETMEEHVHSAFFLPRLAAMLDSSSARRGGGTYDDVTNRVEAIHVLRPDLLARLIQRCLEVDGRQKHNLRIELV
jgi:hypothetical protein